jgi:hypothetical protein
VRFVFDSVDELSNGFLGWMVDDVRSASSAARHASSGIDAVWGWR